MKKSRTFRLLFLVVVVTLIALWIDLPNSKLDFKIKDTNVKKEFPVILGLDLAGGSHLVFEADTATISADKKVQALESAKNIIERRVNLYGVSEPNVQLSSFDGKDRIIVELPGVKDTKEAISVIGQTAQLIFAEVVTVPADKKGDPDKETIKPTDLTGGDLAQAQASFDSASGKPNVSIQFTDQGAKKFEALTGANVGKPLVIVLDNQIVSSPTVQEKIVGGSAQISGSFTTEEAKNLAIQLNAGALPVSVKLVEERTVGATLGAESIQKSIRAGLIGVGIVFLFMIANYGKLGIVANLGLIVYAILTLALYKLIPVVLTLPGIAGFLLSVGMAVDSNILIFERFKEEKINRPAKEAMEVAFGRAWDSIRDANVATLVTAFVLANPFDWSFLNTSGPVRGFAITLALGIVISLFTGIVVSRNLLRVFIRK